MTPEEKRRQTYELKRQRREKEKADKKRSRSILEQIRDSPDTTLSEKLRAIELLQSMK